jgi:hydrogenase expression/formation protein HypC
MGKLDFGGTIRTYCLQCIPDAVVGEYALIHVGFGIRTIDAEGVARTYKRLRDFNVVAYHELQYRLRCAA